MSWLEQVRIDLDDVRSVDSRALGAVRAVEPGTFQMEVRGQGLAADVTFIDAISDERVVGTDADIFAVYWLWTEDEVLSLRREPTGDTDD